MSDTSDDPRILLYDAVKYVLDRRQTDPDLAHYTDPFTETFQRLCRAEAAHLGVSVERVIEARQQDLQPAHRRREADIVVLRRRLDESEP